MAVPVSSEIQVLSAELSMILSRKADLFLSSVSSCGYSADFFSSSERVSFSDWFRAVTPTCMVPVLELDDGTCISESVAICRYFEEIHPEPPLMGRDAKERAVGFITRKLVKEFQEKLYSFILQ